MLIGKPPGNRRSREFSSHAGISGAAHLPSGPREIYGGAANQEGRKMTIRRIDVGPRMSDIVIHNNTVYLAGQVGEGASVAEQTRDVLSKIDALLAKAGSSKSKLLQTIIWLDDMANFAEMNSVWDAWIDPANPPARATGEAKLAAPKYKVEIIIVAAVG
jgi:enamine deaminase RidA (YjgF/YER057c/UK114 family)